jgi:hypothetical protein
MVMMRIAIILSLTVFLSGCGALNSFLGTSIGDYMPDWAGGLPKDAPPRPTDPRYQQYMEEQRAKLETPKPSDQGTDKPAETQTSTSQEGEKQPQAR